MSPHRTPLQPLYAKVKKRWFCVSVVNIVTKIQEEVLTVVAPVASALNAGKVARQIRVIILGSLKAHCI